MITITECKDECASSRYCKGVEFWSGLGTTDRFPTQTCNQCLDINVHQNYTESNNTGFPPSIYAKGNTISTKVFHNFLSLN